MDFLVLFGKGGHATSIGNAWASHGRALPWWVDDSDPLPHRKLPMLVAVGNNRTRKMIAERLAERGQTFGQVCHLTASARGGPGTFCAAFSFVEPSAVVGAHCIINTKTSVDHDCRVDDFAHVGPGATLCGRVHVCEGAFVGAGSVVVDCHKKHKHDGACGIRIGAWSLVRAGTIVQADVPDGAKVGPGVWKG